MVNFRIYYVIIFMIIFLIGDSSSAYLSDYHYRKEHILIGGNETLTDYPILFIIHRVTGESDNNEVYIETKCLPDYSDIRFTLSDDTVLQQAIRYSSEDKAEIVVIIPSIPRDEFVSLYLYYGNNNTPTFSENPDNQMIEQDFDPDASTLKFPSDAYSHGPWEENENVLSNIISPDSLPIAIDDTFIAEHGGIRTYFLGGDVSYSGDIFSPINILSDDVIFSGNNYTISGNSKGKGSNWQIGINAGSPEKPLKNITVKDLSITNWDIGASMQNVNGDFGNEISGITTSNNRQYGLCLENSSNFVISDNQVNDSLKNSVQILNSGNIRIKNNRLNSSGSGVFLGNSTDIHLIENELNNNENGILFDHCSKGQISNNTINKSEINGVRLIYSQDFLISRNTISKSIVGLELESCSDITIDKNQGSHVSQDFIWIDKSEKIVASENHISGGDGGISFITVKDSTLINNYLENMKKIAICLNECSFSVIDSNSIVNAENGIVISKGKEIQVLNSPRIEQIVNTGISYNSIENGQISFNKIKNCGNTGIDLISSSSIIVSHNQIDNTIHAGIYVDSVTNSQFEKNLLNKVSTGINIMKTSSSTIAGNKFMNLVYAPVYMDEQSQVESDVILPPE